MNGSLKQRRNVNNVERLIRRPKKQPSRHHNGSFVPLHKDGLAAHGCAIVIGDAMGTTPVDHAARLHSYRRHHSATSTVILNGRLQYVAFITKFSDTLAMTEICCFSTALAVDSAFNTICP